MRINVGLELNNEGRALAWALDFPGCFAYGLEGPEAVVALARELARYQGWVNHHAGRSLVELGDFDIRLVDTWEVYTVNDANELAEGGYAVNAWFRHDWLALSAAEIEHGLDLLRWSRADLLAVTAGLSEAQLEDQRPGELWSPRGILRHVANAEWWYLDRLNLVVGSPRELPGDVFERLALVRARLEAELPGLAGAERVNGVQGEFWSPRKLLRRALWHEIDHRQHILKLIESGKGLVSTELK